jgi:hypothetical protein
LRCRISLGPSTRSPCHAEAKTHSILAHSHHPQEGEYLGTVEAPTAEAAIQVAINEYDITDPERQKRLGDLDACVVRAVSVLIGAFRILLPWANSGNPQHGNCRCFRHSNAMLPLMESFKSGRREHGGVTPPVERQNSKPFFYLSALLGAREQTKLYRLVRLTCRAAPTC